MRVLARRRDCEYWPQWLGLLWFTAAVLTLVVLTTGCRRGMPVIDTGPRPAQAPGTISGTVRGPEGTSSIDGRVVEVVNLETNERQSVTTNSAGGFTVKVAPGRYRVELTLRDGETFLKRPGVMNVNKSDVDAHADFVIGSPPVSRPRSPAYKTDHGLGAPIA